MAAQSGGKSQAGHIRGYRQAAQVEPAKIQSVVTTEMDAGVTVTCSALHLPWDFSGVKLCQLQTLQKSLGWDYTDSEVPRVLRKQNWDYTMLYAR